MIVINNRFNLSIIKNLIKLFYLYCSCKKVVEKSNKENLRVIRNTLPNKSENFGFAFHLINEETLCRKGFTRKLREIQILK